MDQESIAVELATFQQRCAEHARIGTSHQQVVEMGLRNLPGCYLDHETYYWLPIDTLSRDRSDHHKAQ